MNASRVSANVDKDNVRNPQIKFQPSLECRKRAEEIAEFHALGVNGPSANEFARMVFSQFSRVHPIQFFAALAALEAFTGSVPVATAAHRDVKGGAR